LDGLLNRLRAAATPATVEPMGIGYANSVSTATAIHSATTSSTYYAGTAHPGDNVADICWTVGDGGLWDLLRDGGQNQHIQCPHGLPRVRRRVVR
jgi:hypothetical protein